MTAVSDETGRELKPCPFCGEQPKVFCDHHAVEGDRYWIVCGNPACSVHEKQAKGCAFDAWNNRATLSTAPVVRRIERDAFEEWARADSRNLQAQELEERNDDNNHYYAHDCNNNAFIGWKAAISSNRATPVVDAVATVTYTNWRGETSVRRIIPKSVRYGSTEWHPEPQWLLLAWDDDKKADREFALKDFGVAPVGHDLAVEISTDYERGFEAGRKSWKEVIDQHLLYTAELEKKIASAPVAQEPVAWQYRTTWDDSAAWTNWTYCDLAQHERIQRTGKIGSYAAQSRPLYVGTPPAPAASVGAEEIARALYKSRGMFDDKTVKLHFDWFKSDVGLDHHEARQAIIICYRDANAILSLFERVSSMDSDRIRDALKHAQTRFECLAEDFKNAGKSVDWAMCQTDADRMESAISEIAGTPAPFGETT